MNAVLLVLNAVLMIAMPLLLAWIIHKRRSASWRLFFIGAATFILTQVVHIPFNFFFFSELSGWIANLPELISLITTAALAGLSAGLFEETGRYLSYRYWAKDARSWGRGLMLGAGHGGAEAIILGVLAAVNLSFLFAYRAGFFQDLVPADQSGLLIEAANNLLLAPWFETLLGAIERASALSLHLSLSLLVMQVFTRGSFLWLIIAIGWHALADAMALIALELWGAYVTEAIISLMALISLLIIFVLKEPEPESDHLDELEIDHSIGPIDLEITAEKLDESKYV